MNINKWIFVIASLLIIIINCHAQVNPDSLIGTYAGEKWYKLDSDTEWTISVDTAYILKVDTNNCIIEHLYPATLPSGTGEFETTYSYCNKLSNNWFTRFYSNDSIFIKYDEVSLPPPDFKLWSARFYGKKISSDIPTSIGYIKNETNYTIYPNPFQSEIKISFDVIGQNKIRLIDTNGKSVFYKEVNSQNYLIPTNNLPTGIYLLQITSNNSMNNFKLVKQ